jgi:membrane-associated protease RseP (regulator of RpoE activity)
MTWKVHWKYLTVSLLLLVSLAWAASVHLKGGSKAEPIFFDAGLSLQSAGELAGLGNGDVLVTVLATALPTADCVNPGSGEHRPPGQNPAAVEVTGSQSIPESEIKNGNTPFSVMTLPPETPIPEAPDCPNDRWTENITDLAFTSALITVEQPRGTIVLVVSCTIDPPSEDGVVSPGDVTCISE